MAPFSGVSKPQPPTMTLRVMFARSAEREARRRDALPVADRPRPQTSLEAWRDKVQAPVPLTEEETRALERFDRDRLKPEVGSRKRARAARTVNKMLKAELIVAPHQVDLVSFAAGVARFSDQPGIYWDSAKIGALHNISAHTARDRLTRSGIDFDRRVIRVNGNRHVVYRMSIIKDHGKIFQRRNQRG